MPRVLEVRGDYKVLSTNRDYIVINTALPYAHHAHFKKLETLRQFLRILEIGKAPTSPYLLKAARRLLGDGFDTLTQPRKKQTYCNRQHSKGSKRAM